MPKKQKILLGLGLFVLGGIGGFCVELLVGSTHSEVNALLADRPHLWVDSVDSVLLIRGQAKSFGEYLEVESIADKLADRGVRSVVMPSPQARQQIAESIEREIGSPDITASAMEDSVVLEGVALSDFEADRAVELALIKLRLSGRARAKTLGSAGSGSGPERWPASVIDMLRIAPKTASQ